MQEFRLWAVYVPLHLHNVASSATYPIWSTTNTIEFQGCEAGHSKQVQRHGRAGRSYFANQTATRRKENGQLLSSVASLATPATLEGRAAGVIEQKAKERRSPMRTNPILGCGFRAWPTLGGGGRG